MDENETDDFDDLIREVEEKFLTPAAAKHPNKNRTPQVKGNQEMLAQESKIAHVHRDKKSKTKELDDLLAEFGEDHEKHIPKSSKPQKSSDPKGFLQNSVAAAGHDHKSAAKSKCITVIIAGSQFPQGISTAVNQRACDHLRCTDCDFQVASFENFKWHSSTDYLFLRNNMPDYEKLKSNLSRKKGTRAYACQCQWRSVKEPVNVTQELNLKWVCGKH